MAESQSNPLPEALRLNLWHRGDPPSWILDRLDPGGLVEVARAYVEAQTAMLQAELQYAQRVGNAIGKMQR